jgi:ABC-type bacteriocin/lantibiotic exporter with double-glycine peptidase domain
LFNSLNLTIKKGVVAIVGSSGNGKSTLLNLLMKFYEPFKGEIILSNASKSQKLKKI